MLPLPNSRTEEDRTSSYHIMSNAILRAIPRKQTSHTIALLRTKLRLMFIKKVVWCPFKNWLFIIKSTAIQRNHKGLHWLSFCKTHISTDPISVPLNNISRVSVSGYRYHPAFHFLRCGLFFGLTAQAGMETFSECYHYSILSRNKEHLLWMTWV